MNIDITSSLHFNISSSTHQPLLPPCTPNTTMTSQNDAENKKPTTIYFGFGSNLWRHQMRQRCPTSKYLGIARLKGYKWIIYDRGYANIVELEDDEKEGNEEHDYSEEVWGLVYSLEEDDEERLDRNEGVPIAYRKEWIECEFWATSESEEQTRLAERMVGYFGSNGRDGKPDISKKAEKVDMLVYIDRKRTEESEPKREYVYRMNMGIKDAVREGVPEDYVRQVMRRFIPEKSEEEVEEVARRQALEFEDEG